MLSRLRSFLTAWARRDRFEDAPEERRQSRGPRLADELRQDVALRPPRAAAQSAVRLDRDRFARSRHRREHGDLLVRRRDPDSATAGARAGPPRRLRANTPRRTHRCSVAVEHHRRSRRGNADILGGLRLVCEADQSVDRRRRPMDQRRAGDGPVLPHPWSAPGHRPSAERRGRAQRNRRSGLRSQPRALATRVRRRPRRRRTNRSAERAGLPRRRRDGERLPRRRAAPPVRRRGTGNAHRRLHARLRRRVGRGTNEHRFVAGADGTARRRRHQDGGAAAGPIGLAGDRPGQTGPGVAGRRDTGIQHCPTGNSVNPCWS